MNMQNLNRHFQEEELIDLRSLYMKVLHHWSWFFISILFFTIATTFYLRRTAPEYNVSASILIKDAQKGVGGTMSEMGLFRIWECFLTLKIL